MMRIVMEQAGLTFWPALSLVIFFLVSLATVVWLYRPGSRDFYRKMSDIALQDGSLKINGTNIGTKTETLAPTPKPSAEE
jgi:cbb3-type cytochrome oxidase subunit 3